MTNNWYTWQLPVNYTDENPNKVTNLVMAYKKNSLLPCRQWAVPLTLLFSRKKLTCLNGFIHLFSFSQANNFLGFFDLFHSHKSLLVLDCLYQCQNILLITECIIRVGTAKLYR